MKTIALFCFITFITLSSCNRKAGSAVKDDASELKEEKTKVEKEVTTNNRPDSAKEKLSDEKSNTDDPRFSNDAENFSDDYKNYYEQGYAKHNAGDFSGAIGAFSKSIEINPQFAEAWNFRGLSKFKSGDKNGACSDWREASSLGYQSANDLIQNYCR